jgi:hypothetical protein
VASVADVQDGLIDDGGLDVASSLGLPGETGEGVEFADGFGEMLELDEVVVCFLAELLEEGLLAGDGALFGGEGFALELFELWGGVSLGVFEGLLGRPVGGRAGGVGGGGFDVVAEDFVEADLEVVDAGLFDELALILGEPVVAVVLLGSAFVEFGVVAIADESALAEVGGWGIDAGVGDECGPIGE